MKKDQKNKQKTRQIIHVLFFAFLILGLLDPIKPALASSANTFLVDEEYDRLGRSEIEAVLHYTSQNAYFYIEKDYYEMLSSSQKAIISSRITEIANNFDRTIYPQTRKIFGEEWSPGIDGDSRIIVLMTRLDYNVGGYFNPNDEYAKDSVVNEKSNEKEMLYINPDFINDPRLESFVAHEFQHMITWNQKTREEGIIDDIWTNESRSELASTVTEDALGINFLKGNSYTRKNLFLLNYWDSLTDWNNRNYDYGTVSMFSQYLKDQLGTELFAEITSSDKSGLDSIDYVLKNNYHTDFRKIFTNWTIANYINDTNFNKSYGYKSENLQGEIVRPEKVQIDPEESQMSVETDLKNWSSKYYEVSFIKREEASFYIDINFNGNNSGVFTAPYIVTLKNGEKQVKLLELNDKQDGIIRIKSTNNIESIAILPSSQKENEVLDDAESNQVGNYIFRLSLNITPIDEKTLSNILAEGSLVKTIDSEKIYVIENEKKRWIANPETFASRGYAWNNIVTISNDELEQYANGEKLDTKTEKNLNGLLVKSIGPEVYLIQNNQRRWIQNEAIFNSYSFSWEKIMNISDQDLLSYSQGENLSMFPFKSGSLIKGEGNEVYFVDGNIIRWITSPEIFAKSGYQWASIIKTTNDIISYLIKGPEVK